MLAIDKLDYDKVLEVAQNMGYDPRKPTELNKYINDISKMDLWDISEILFFGKEEEEETMKTILRLTKENKVLTDEVRRLRTELEEAKRQVSRFQDDLMYSVLDSLLHQAKSLSTLTFEQDSYSRPRNVGSVIKEGHTRMTQTPCIEKRMVSFTEEVGREVSHVDPY